MSFDPLNPSSSKSTNITIFHAVYYASQGNIFDFLQTSALLKFCPIYETMSMNRYGFVKPVDTGRKLSVSMTFRKRPG